MGVDPHKKNPSNIYPSSDLNILISIRHLLQEKLSISDSPNLMVKQHNFLRFPTPCFSCLKNPGNYETQLIKLHKHLK